MKKVSTATWVARIFGLLVLILLWVGAFVPGVTSDHYNNMHDGGDALNIFGMILLTVAGLGIVGWYDVETLVNDARGASNRKPIKTMYFQIGQFVLGAIGVLLMAA